MSELSKEMLFADQKAQDAFSLSDKRNLAERAVELKRRLGIDFIVTEKGLAVSEKAA